MNREINLPRKTEITRSLMPNTYIDKLVATGKGSRKNLDSKWEKAKAIAVTDGEGENYAYITGIFKKMIDEEFIDRLLSYSDYLRELVEGE